MRFSQTNAPVKEQWVIGFRRPLGDGKSCGMSELIGRTNNKRIKGVLRIKRIVDRFKIEISLGRRWFSRRLFDHVDDTDISHACIASRVENDVKVFVQPILAERVGDAHIKCGSFTRHELSGFKPRVIALRVNFFFNFTENLLPGIHEMTTSKRAKISTRISTSVENRLQEAASFPCNGV